MCRAEADGGRRCPHRPTSAARALARAEQGVDRRWQEAEQFFAGAETAALVAAAQNRDGHPVREAISRWVVAFRAVCAWVDRAMERRLDRQCAELDARMDALMAADDAARRVRVVELRREIAAAERRVTDARLGLMLYRQVNLPTGFDTRQFWSDGVLYFRGELRNAEAALRPSDAGPDARGLPKPRQRRVNELCTELARWEREALIPGSEAAGEAAVTAATGARDALHSEMVAVAEGRTPVLAQ